MHSYSLMKFRLNRSRSFRGGLMATAVLVTLTSVFAGSMQARAQSERLVRISSAQPADTAQLGAKFFGWTPSTQIIPLSITLPLRNQAQLADFLKRLYNPHDPEYRHYLTGAQFD